MCLEANFKNMSPFEKSNYKKKKAQVVPSQNTWISEEVLHKMQLVVVLDTDLFTKEGNYGDDFLRNPHVANTDSYVKFLRFQR